MKLYKGTGSHVVLIGILTEVPSLRMNEVGDFIATISIAISMPNQDTPSCYLIVALGDSALNIRRYGFPGLYLWIEGAFHIQEKNTQVIAEKIIFLDGSEPNPSHIQNCALANSFFVSPKQNMLIDQEYFRY